MAQCPNCKRSGAPDAKFCDRCGTPLPESTHISGAHGTNTAFKFGTFLTALSNMSINYLKTLIALVLVVLVIIIIALSFTSAGSLNSLSYLKDNELYYTTISQVKGKQVSSDLLDGASTIGNLDELVRISNDGKRIFFVDKYDGNGYDLYYKNTGRLKRESEKLVSDINIYDINDKGNLVTYIKDGGDLYQHNLRDQSERIDEDVMTFVVSDNGNNIVYFKVDNEASTYCIDVYQSKGGKTGKSVLTGIESVCKISDDLKSIYYLQYGTFYKATIGKDPEKIADNVSEVVKIYDSGECYYVQRDEEGVSSLYYYNGKSELVSNGYYSYEDVADTSPVIIFCADISVNDTKVFAFKVAVKNKTFDIDNGFSFDLNAKGDELRYLVNSDESSQTTYTLYSCDVSKNGVSDKKQIDTEVYSGSFVSEDNYMYFKNYHSETTTGDVYFNDRLVDKNIYCGYINYNDESNSLVYFTDVNETNDATLMIYKGRKSSKVRDDVYMHSLIFAPEGEFAFLADYKNGDGTLYICKNKRAKRVDIDVSSIVRFLTNEEYDQKIITNI